MRKGGLIHAERLKNDPQYLKKYSEIHSERFRTLHQQGKLRYDNFSGKSHSEESKKKISETRKRNNPGLGQSNSQYGTTWIWCSKLGNKKIKKDELEKYLDDGWIKTYKPGYKPE